MPINDVDAQTVQELGQISDGDIGSRKQTIRACEDDRRYDRRAAKGEEARNLDIHKAVRIEVASCDGYCAIPVRIDNQSIPIHKVDMTLEARSRYLRQRCTGLNVAVCQC